MADLKILVLDNDWIQTGYLVAELSRANIEVILASPSQRSSRMLRRYCRHVQTPAVTDPGYTEFLRALSAREDADFVYAACDPAQHALWTSEELLPGNIFPQTAPWQRDLLTDRRQCYEFVSRLGLLTPRMLSIPDIQAAESVVATLGLPCIIRGTQGCGGSQVNLVCSADQARTAYKILAQTSPGCPFGQEFVAGQRCLIGGLFHQGTALQLFSQCTLEAVDPTGPSIRVRSLCDPVLTDRAKQLFGALRWDGLACAEFIRTDAGQYFFLEINARPWAAIRAAHRCGIPLLRQFAQYLTGRYTGKPRAYPHGKDCTLFPAFFMARIRSARFPRVKDLKAYWQATMAAPWTQLALLRHHLHLIRWSFSGGTRQYIRANAVQK